MNYLLKTLPFFLFTLTATAQDFIQAESKVFGAANANASTESHYQVLARKFAEAGPVTKEEMEGAFLGRCFLEKDNIPIGMCNTTRKFEVVTGQNDGPLFPPETSIYWKNIYGLMTQDGIGLPAESNDSVTSREINAMWEEQGNQISILSETNGVVQGKDPKTGYSNETKKGADGFLYGKYSFASDPDVAYCYFYKKLF